MPENLSSAMHSATENLHPNIGKLTTGGIERGVRKRRTRRISQIAGAAASVTAVFGVVAMVGAPGHGGSAGVSAAAGQPAAAVQSSQPQNASTEAAPGPGKPTAAAVSGPDMVTWLEQALQPYNFTNEKVLYKAGTDELAGPFATLQLDYSAGTGSISLNIARSPWSLQHIGGKVPYVTVSTLNDGSHLMVFDGPEWPAGNGDPSAKRLEVSWYRNDGTMVDIQALNEATEKGATTASKPALTVDQATQVVQSPVWDKAIASVLAKPAPNAKSVPGAGNGTDLQKKTVGGAAGSSGSGSPSSPTQTSGR
ncbi:hypothetical protein ABIA35_002718 [Catenulispora sp. MAP12-49]|uniref:hypothetical protein n=1 Tax=Catenulispora sp. MAP12-49 TaxID=3156302 RepID=UPI0035130FBD